MVFNMTTSIPCLINMALQPLLSICIPTNGAVEYVVPSLESIYGQEVDASSFEVVITDNGVDSHLEEFIKKLKYPNLRYIKTNAQGFMNQICAFKESQGAFIKMINHRALFHDGSLQKMIDFIKAYQEKKPMLYFPNGHLGGIKTTQCQNLDDFLNKVSFWSSWEQGVGIWQEDKKKLDDIHYDRMFPAASILFNIREHSPYIVCDNNFTYEKPSKRMRRYDFFQVFAVEFLDVLHHLNEQTRISEETFNFVRKDMYRRYLISYYYQIVVAKTDRAIPPKNIMSNMSKYYSIWDYYWMCIYCHTAMRLKNLFKK